MRSPLTFAVLLSGCLLATTVSAQQKCNGYSEHCSKTYNSLTYVLTHNSYGYTSNPAANQLCPINSQLADGVRGLKLSAVKPSNSSSASEIHLCHTSCSILDAGPAKDTLTSLTSWLKSNPNEVVTIMWNNLGDFAASDFEEIYKSSGILDYTHTQNADNYNWPTLQDMISSGKRVVNFLDVGADQSSVPWLHSEFDYVFETPYNNKNESSFSCTIDRPKSPADPDSMMYVMNHFLYGSLTLGSSPIEIPQKGTANITNSDSLMKQAQSCSQTFGRPPTFLEVDFYNKGDTMAIAAKLNNVSYVDKPLQCDQTAEASGKSNQDSAATAVMASPLLLLMFTLASLLLV
ncbi:PLC-like phosphodiesterase [Radiomyces spectabilis]|uniref:PLC-like phosphodiesterase n=1 Tax=Radiomyces spectabilis TaxID=64574 RepID=UPI00222079F7|nr:PLC-like phosphodiesterase [Radiomyces spectabilis]KAI8394152.1 PLC-like phosphodiesterase [Radiomyces spectabilis]